MWVGITVEPANLGGSKLTTTTQGTEIDIEVEDIDTKELMEDESRLDKITDYIIAPPRSQDPQPAVYGHVLHQQICLRWSSM